MADSSSTDVFESLRSRIESAVLAAYPAARPLEVEAFFADELVFASVTHRGDDGAVQWRSSHAATPDSHSTRDLAAAGEELLDRIVADALLAAAVEGDSDGQQ